MCLKWCKTDCFISNFKDTWAVTLFMKQSHADLHGKQMCIEWDLSVSVMLDSKQSGICQMSIACQVALRIVAVNQLIDISHIIHTSFSCHLYRLYEAYFCVFFATNMWPWLKISSDDSFFTRSFVYTLETFIEFLKWANLNSTDKIFRLSFIAL